MSLLLHLLCAVATVYDTAVAESFSHVVYNHNSKCVAYKALPACFGPPLPVEGLTGYMIRATPPKACHAIEHPPATSNISEIYIALIEGSGCSFVEKVLHAQQAGYQAAVVYSADSERLINMMPDDKKTQQQIEIPSLFTGESVFLHLQRILHYERGACISLIPPKHYLNPCQDAAKILWDTTWQYWLLLMKYPSYYILNCVAQEFGFVFNMIIATLTLVVGMSWYKKAHRITVRTYQRGDKYETCVICMAEYEEGDQLKILPCSHAYHCACIDTWLRTQPGKKTCPFCKQQVNPHGQCIHLDLRNNPPEHTGEGLNEEEEEEEEQNHEDHAFREGHGQEYVEGEKDDCASTVEEEGFEDLENSSI
ncbi:E3 ubiquitin-protein ligase RNF167-like [Nothoprocta perdicaria]|uniref:E3 ubiquitin-protein ligase RNF167-like n=1 Tax=Nothoprocta perdicaria TaxID=30464 RepID=UPI000E1BFF98|nr:E3 ubiquitin-protein ligase RNF167-like [Nothoprocta perdicaria]